MTNTVLNEPIDAIENKIYTLSPSLMKILIKDKTTGSNLHWATNTYEKFGEWFLPEREMKIEQLVNANILTPRVSKSIQEQQARTKDKGEVFTPAWMCNKMNNFIDEDWFERSNVFNKELENDWKTNKRKITFSKKLKKTWDEYISNTRLEITCGEAPYLVSRYDVVKGRIIPVEERIGILDRKLRIINENIADENKWLEQAKIAFESTYGYDYQGDNVVIARENLLYTLIDNMIFKFGHQPDLDILKQFAEIVTWNIWQMDGIDYTIPYSEIDVKPTEIKLGLYEEDENETKKEKQLARIKNWKTNKTLTFKELTGDNKMKFDYIIGNPPYQKTKGGTKNIDIWPDFLFSSTKLADSIVLIHPGRWIVPKKQMKQTHERIIKSGLKSFNYYPDSSKVFSNTGIDGGVTITCFKSNYNGKVDYYNNSEYFGEYKEGQGFVSNKYEEEALRKIKGSLKYFKTMNDRILGNVGSLGGTEFGYSKTQQIGLLSSTIVNLKNPIKIWANNNYGKGTRFQWYFIEKSELKNVPDKLFSSRKVMLDKKGHAISNGTANIINNIPKIVDKMSTASGDVLFVFPDNDDDYELKLIQSLFMTKTARFLMSITQKDLYVRGFENVPDYSYFIKDLNGKLFCDNFFYNKFNFSEELINHIEKHISPKNIGSEDE